MATLKEEAINFKPKETKNIADLEKVPVDIQVFEGNGVDKTSGKPYKYKFALFNDEEYRIPDSVLQTMQEIIKVRPDLEFVKVTKKGSGLNTKYNVVSL